MAQGLLIFFGLLAAYLLLLVVLVRTRLMERYNMALFLGVILMVRTTRGQGLLNWFAKARGFFDRSALVGLWLTVFVMVAMTLLILVQIPLALRASVEQEFPARIILAIPGINPIIPIGAGIIGLVVAIVVHEYSHGIMARVYDFKVKSMGLLFLIVPIGAFVEPDEEDMKKATRSQRLKVFSAGPLSNLVLAILFAALFSASIAAGVVPLEGVPVTGIEEASPAHTAGMLPGWRITHMNGTPTPCLDDFRDAMKEVDAGTTVALTVQEERGAAPRTVEVTTARRADLYSGPEYDQLYAENPEAANETVIGFAPHHHCFMHDVLSRPLGSPAHAAFYTFMPLLALQGQYPLAAPFTDFYATPGWMPAGLFWGLAGIAYWIFWLNLMVGMTNALPLMPLDGGHMFRDLVDGTLARLRPGLDPERRRRIVNRITAFMAFFILFAIIFLFFGSRILAAIL